MADARVVNVSVGASVPLPPVKMDGRGALTGLVRDAQTHAPLAFANVGIATFNAGAGPSSAQVSTDERGRYTFEGLGPYKWAIFTSAPSEYAPEWSGHTPNRLRAKGVKVRADRTRTYDINLGRGVTLTGLVTTPTGQPAGTAARITATHAASDDELAAGDTDVNGRYTIHLLGNQAVTLGVNAFLDDVSYQFLYNNGHPVSIPKNGTKTINITLR
jgi:hypothetical protein